MFLDYKIKKKIIHKIKNKKYEKKIRNQANNEKNFRNQAKDMIKEYRQIDVKNFKKNSNYETVFIDFRIIEHVEFLIRNVIYKFDENWCHSVVCGNFNYIYI